MSADNGVYILVSRGRKTRHGFKKEYRVIHAQAIENIDWSPDYPVDASEPKLNREMVLVYFGEARVMSDRRIAEGYAQCLFDEMERDGGFVEYGIRWLDDFADVPFPQPQRRRRRRSPKLTAVS